MLSATSVNCTAPARFETNSSPSSNIAFLTELSLIWLDDLIARYQKTTTSTSLTAAAARWRHRWLAASFLNRTQSPEIPKDATDLIDPWPPLPYSSRKVAYNQNLNKAATLGCAMLF